ncbi:MAG: S-layer homology domain-containing protein [Defluviitaleaceae bacterium]|nr:S-layer homology domain-containing protein [Defluviitaleaceae bacterium]
MALRKFALTVLITILFATPVFAQTSNFRDVQPSHFAFEAINWVSDPANGAFMVGDAGNNFHPSRHLNKFEAAQIYAMAAGFRHVTHNLPEAERAVFARSLETWRTFLDTMANEYSSWNRTVDREIAFLLYRGILTTTDVQGFVVRNGTEETRPLLTRQQAVAWMVRLVGQAPQAGAISLPHHTPFRDDAQIAPIYRQYVYHARELGIVQGAGGYMNPTAHFTRAEMATVFHNALANRAIVQTATPGAPATISGTIANVHQDSHVSITSAAGTETFSIAANAVIMVDNTQRTAAALQDGMTVTVLVNASRQVISLVARSQVPGTAASAAPAPILHADEGVITAVTAEPSQTITIRTQRLRITGQILDEERTFSFAPNAVITRGGTAAEFNNIKIGDIAFFGFTQTAIHTLELMERERTLIGVLKDVRPPESGNPAILILEEEEGRVYELRALPATEFSRGSTTNLKWDDLRIGDALTAEVEFDRIIKVNAVGQRSSADGRLNEIRITERNTEITITQENGSVSSFIIRPGVLDVYTLRIGMQLRIALDSREVTGLQARNNEQDQSPVILGFIQSIRTDGSIVVAEGTTVTARTHTLTVPASALITRGGAELLPNNLRTNMNVYIVLTSPGATTVQSITILP